MQERRERTQHVLDVEIGQRPDIVVADLVHAQLMFGGRLVVVRRRGRHHEHAPGQERQPRRQVVSAPGPELGRDGPSPEQSAGPVGGELERVHVHLRARVLVDLCPELGGENDRVPVVDHRLGPVRVQVVHRVVDRRRWRGGLAGAVHPEREQPPVAPGVPTGGRGPVQCLLAHPRGQVGHRVQVEDGPRGRTLHHPGGDRRHERLLADLATVPGDRRLDLLGQVHPGQRAGPGPAGGQVLDHDVQLLGRGRVLRIDGRQVGVRPVRTGGEADRHVPPGGLLDHDLGVVHPLLRAPAVPRVVDVALVHGEELHPAVAQPVSGVDLAAQRLVGVQTLGEPPAQLGPVLDGGRLDQATQVVDSHQRVLLRTWLVATMKRYNGGLIELRQG